MVISSTKSSWRPGDSGVRCAQPCSTSSLMIWMMEQRVPLAGLLVVCNWEGWPVHKGIVLPSRCSLKVWRNGLTGSSGNSTKENAKSFRQAETSLGALGADQLEVAQQRRTRASGRHHIKCEPKMCPCHKGGQWSPELH